MSNQNAPLTKQPAQRRVPLFPLRQWFESKLAGAHDRTIAARIRLTAAKVGAELDARKLRPTGITNDNPSVAIEIHLSQYLVVRVEPARMFVYAPGGNMGNYWPARAHHEIDALVTDLADASIFVTQGWASV